MEVAPLARSKRRFPRNRCRLARPRQYGRLTLAPQVCGLEQLETFIAPLLSLPQIVPSGGAAARFGESVFRPRRPAQRLQAANVLTNVRRILAAIDGVGAGAVPTQFPRRLPLQSDLIFLPAAVHVPQEDAARFSRPRIAIRQSITVRTRLAFARRPRQRSEKHTARPRMFRWSHGTNSQQSLVFHAVILSRGGAANQG